MKIVGNHANSTKNNHGGAVDNVRMRKNIRQQETIFPLDEYQKNILQPA